MTQTTQGSPEYHTPTEDEVVSAIDYVWGRVLEAFSTMGISRLHRCIKQDNPTWSLSEGRLKDIKTRGMADGRLKQPAWYTVTGIRQGLKPSKERVKGLDNAYTSARRWRDTLPAEVEELHGTFEITSGELVWGQSRQLARGLTTTQRDLPGADRKEESPGTVIQASGFCFRAPAKSGTWRIAVVEGAGRTDVKSGWLAYHSSASPMALLKEARLVNFGTRTSNPRITYVNRYDWAWYSSDPGQLFRTLADLDPETWEKPFGRKKGLWIEGKSVDRYHKDSGLWERLDKFKFAHCFLMDAEKTASVLKLMARPTEFDKRVEDKKPSSFIYPRPSAAKSENQPFGCNVPLHPCGEYEVARLIFDPKVDELIAFWYDTTHYEYDSDELAVDPFFEDV